MDNNNNNYYISEQDKKKKEERKNTLHLTPLQPRYEHTTLSSLNEACCGEYTSHKWSLSRGNFPSALFFFLQIITCFFNVMIMWMRIKYTMKWWSYDDKYDECFCTRFIFYNTLWCFFVAHNTLHDNQKLKKLMMITTIK